MVSAIGASHQPLVPATKSGEDASLPSFGGWHFDLTGMSATAATAMKSVSHFAARASVWMPIRDHVAGAVPQPYPAAFDEHTLSANV
jgi:hypothetical protein